MNNWAIISSKTRVYQALVLIDSIRDHGDNSNIHILATDDDAFEVLSSFSKGKLNFYVYKEEDVVSKDIISLKQSRRYFSYCWTLKSIFCNSLIEKTALNDTVSYIDSDIVFFGNVTHYLSEKLYSTFFTSEEHYLPSWDDERVDNLKKIVGNYNSGFISFRNDVDGKASLLWWMDKCIESCDVNSDVFGDQKYLNEMPVLFSGVFNEESLKLNVGPWNILKRKIIIHNKNVKFGDFDLLFYHYVGLRLTSPKSIEFMVNIPTTFEDYFKENPSGVEVYYLYEKLLNEKVKEVKKYFPSFNGYSGQDSDDWAAFQIENNVLNLN